MHFIEMPSHAPYGPAEDTWLLEDALKNLRQVVRSVEVGCGTGYITKILSEKSLEVIAIEKDAQSAYEAEKNLKNNLYNIHIVVADGFDPIRTSAEIDLIVSNPPYLPLDEAFYDMAIHGGPTGVEVTEMIVKQALPYLQRKGELFIISSSLGNQKKLFETISSLRLKVEIISTKRFFFEELSCLKIFYSPHE